MSDTERLIVLVEAKLNAFEKNMAKAKTIANRDFKAVEDRSKQAASRMDSAFANVGNRMASSFRTMGVALAGAVSVSAITAAAQKYVALTNTLKVASLEGRQLEQVFNGLFQIAQKNGTPIDALATLYSRAAQAQGELKASSAELMQFTNGVSLALRVAGTDSTQAAGALLQLSQALGSGKVQAEEFNSINEGARPILQAVAAGLKEAGGNVSTLKALVNDGKLSSEAFFRAFLVGMPQLEKQVATTQGTVGQGLTRVSNAFTTLVGELDKTLAASEGSARGLTSVSEVVEKMPGYLKAAEKGFSELQSWMTKVGNNPVWEKLGRAMGLKYTAEEAEAAGLIVGPSPTRNSGGAEYARSKEGQALYVPPIKPISLADYAVKGKETGNGGLSDEDRRYNQVEDYIAQLERSSRILQAEFDTLGKSNAERAKAVELARIGNVTDADQVSRISAAVTENENLRTSIERVKQAQEGLKEAATAAGNAITDGLADVLVDGKSVEETINGLIKQFARLALQAAFMGSGPLGGLTGGGGGILGSIFGGFRAEGGPVTAGRAYVVGEKRPEVFVPQTPGTILPSIPTGGSVQASTTNNFNVSVSGGGGTPDQNQDLADRIVKQLREEAHAIVGRELRTQQRPGGMLNSMR